MSSLEVFGPPGIGKSTFLNHILGTSPSRGTVHKAMVRSLQLVSNYSGGRFIDTLVIGNKNKDIRELLKAIKSVTVAEECGIDSSKLRSFERFLIEEVHARYFYNDFLFDDGLLQRTMGLCCTERSANLDALDKLLVHINPPAGLILLDSVDPILNLDRISKRDRIPSKMKGLDRSQSIRYLENFADLSLRTYQHFTKRDVKGIRIDNHKSLAETSVDKRTLFDALRISPHKLVRIR